MGGVLAMIAHLYEVEKVGAPERVARGRIAAGAGTEARPMLNQLHEYLLAIREQVLPKSEAGQAIAYTLKNWTALTRYCSDGDLLIDNNATERSLRSFAVGRNNWTFFGSDNGGKTAAVLRSFVSSCELAQRRSVCLVQRCARPHCGAPVKRIEELLPHRWSQVAL